MLKNNRKNIIISARSRKRVQSFKPARRRSFVHRLIRLLALLVLLFLGTSVLVVLLLRWIPVPASSFMIQNYVQTLRAGESLVPLVNYNWVPYEAISPHMALAVVAAEDQRFPHHRGIDFAAIRQALQERAQGERLRGASTISQQVAKNLFLWPGRSLLRKGLEAWFTLLLELCWTKQRILEVYLNIIELGQRTFGVEAASQRFFSKSAEDIGSREAALLAAVLPNPVRYRVEAPSQYVRKRQAWILEQMERLGGLDYLDNL